ncbi:MAG: transglycosylase SLT domain-containing protein [Halioglobus sp.]
MRFTARHFLAVLTIVISVVQPAAAAGQVAVSVPIRLDYPLLQQLFSKQLFNEPNNSRTLLNDAGSCNQTLLTEPRLRPKDTNLEIQARVATQLGLGLFGRCFTLINWEGGVSFLGLPVIRSGGTALGLKPQGIWLTGSDGERITSGRLWDYAQQPVRDLFSSFTINLSPFTASVGSLLPDLLPRQSQQQMQDTLASLKLADLQVTDDTLKASLNFTVQSVADALPAEPALSPEELQQWEVRWQTMDALLVFAVKHYAAATHQAALRSTLLDILIDSRYQLVAALAEPIDPSNDLVRTWFVESWQKLSPVVRNIALEQEGKETLMWISVLTATDALYALDQLGPQIGFDISTDGLRRLARMINRGVQPEELRYDEALDPQLRQLFEQQLERRSAVPAAWHINFSLIAPAYAAQNDRLDLWVPAPEEVDEYLTLVAQLLDTSSNAMLHKYKLDKAYHDLFRKLVLATAWQESCWRQFVVKDEQITPLLSSTGDVGLMQMNERVWRGFYDLQKLRWNIAYNSNAGAEVLLDYLVKYAINRNEHTHAGGVDNLARASYSAYNGGPGKASRYRKTDVTAFQKKVDTAFWKKYQKINAGEQSGIARCLGAVS